MEYFCALKTCPTKMVKSWGFSRGKTLRKLLPSCLIRRIDKQMKRGYQGAQGYTCLEERVLSVCDKKTQ